MAKIELDVSNNEIEFLHGLMYLAEQDLIDLKGLEKNYLHIGFSESLSNNEKLKLLFKLEEAWKEI